MELYIIRHAQSYNNALADMRDRVKDPPLTELGHRQARRIAEHLANGISPELQIGASDEDTTVRQRRGYGLTRLYCSAMHRALQTARPIGEALGLTPEVWVEIHEHGGIFLDHFDGRGPIGYPGKTRAEILEEFPGTVVPKAITDEGWWRGDEEDWPACQGRAIKVASELRRLAREVGRGERVAMVTHGGFIDALLKALFSQLPSNRIFYYHYNTAITCLDFQDGGHLGVRYLNRVPHLTPDLVS